MNERLPLFRWLLAILLLCLVGCSDETRAPSICGNGVCDPGESATCSADCSTDCGDCIQGYTCNGSSSCVCDDRKDGYCPTGCPRDPDCSSCTPSCDDRMCGDDGCGESCGECGSGERCDDGQCVAACVPVCDGKSCGPDGCGGSCGECGSGERCDGGQCISSCVPDCSEKVCGSDGCGGVCGSGCGDGETCVDFQCEPLDARCGGLDPVACSSLAWGSCADEWVWRTPFTEVAGSLYGLLGGEERIWITGENGFLAFHDGSFLYKVQDPVGGRAIADLWRTHAGHLWAVGEGGQILLGDGDCWAQVPSPTTAYLLGIWGNDAGDLWAVGDDSTVLRFKGGKWVRQTIPGVGPDGWRGTIRDVWGSGNDVWMVGSSSLILHFDGSRSTYYGPMWDTHNFRRVFARGAEVWALSAAGWWTHFDGSGWETLGRPDLLLDMWGEGEDVWRTWAHSGSGTGGLERSWNGGSTFVPVDGVNDLTYNYRLAFGGELWGLRPTQAGTDLLRVVNDRAVSIGGPENLELRGVSASLRLPSNEWLVMGDAAVFRHGDAGWVPEALPSTLQSRAFPWVALRGDEVWAANSWNPFGGPLVATWKAGEWSWMSLPTTLAFQAYGFGCSGSECFLAAGNQGVLRFENHDAGWSKDEFEYTPADGVVVALAVDGDENWIGINRNGVGSLHRRGSVRWEKVGGDIAPMKALAHGAGSTWALTTTGDVHRAAGDTLTAFGSLPRTIAGHTMQWQHLLIYGESVFILADKVVCMSSVEEFTVECLGVPFSATFTRLVPSPTGVWAQTSRGTFIELRR